MKLCFFGIYKSDYSRNNIVMNGLRAQGIEVIECKESSDDPARYSKLIRKLRVCSGSCDAIFAAYPSPVPAIIAKLFSRKKVIVDAFYSMYDATVHDRKEYSRFHPKAIKLLAYDWLSVLVSDMILVDTEMHKEYWASWWFVRKDKIRVLPLGVDPKAIYPITEEAQLPKKVSVTFIGTYIPLQGVDKIIQSFALLKERKDISFRMVGSGQESKKAADLIAKLGLKERIELVGRVSYSDMNRYLNATDIVLGVFGNSKKAARVVPNKVYEGCSARKAVITSNTAAVRDMYGPHDMLMVKAESQAIADAIVLLIDNPDKREEIAQNGYKTTHENYTPKPIGALLVQYLKELIS